MIKVSKNDSIIDVIIKRHKSRIPFLTPDFA